MATDLRLPILLTAILACGGCVAADEVKLADDVKIAVEFTPFDLTSNATVAAPVSTGVVHGNVTTFNVASVSAWWCAALAGALWVVSGWKRRTAVKALDRVMGAIEVEHETQDELQTDAGNISQALLKCMKRKIGRVSGGEPCDAPERLIRKRLAKMKK